MSTCMPKAELRHLTRHTVFFKKRHLALIPTRNTKMIKAFYSISRMTETWILSVGVQRT